MNILFISAYNQPIKPLIFTNIFIYLNTKVYKYLKIFGYFLVCFIKMIYLCTAI